MLVIASVIGNYVVYSSKQLEEPIIFLHRSEVPLLNGYYFEFHYLTNRSDNVGIAWVMIPGTDIQLPATYDRTLGTYNHYLHKVADFEITDIILEEIKNDMQINELDIFFTNGESKRKEVGDIHFFVDNRDAPLLSQSSSSSSDGSGSYLLIAETNIEVTEIQVPFIDNLQSGLSLEINEVKYESGKLKEKIDQFTPFTRNSGEPLTINYHLNFNQTDPNRLHIYKFYLMIKGKDEDDKPFRLTVPINHSPYFNEKDIIEIVKEAR